MATYYARYIAGDCEAVCRELLKQDSFAKDAGFLSDALSVACELVDRAYKNLRQLFDRLVGFGYMFQDADNALVEASSSDLSMLDTVERTIGVLPWVVRKWYERIRSVDFSQEPSQLFSQGASQCVSVSGLGLNTPLIYQSIPKCLELQERLSSEALSEGGASERFAHFLPLGGWASNSEPKGFSLPCDSFDGVFYNEGAGNVYFVEELRTTFKWGGFPFWRRMLTGKKQAYPIRCIPNYDSLLPKLTEGLAPI